MSTAAGSKHPAAPHITAYHSKYYAHDLTRRAPGGIDRISMSLFDATVDLNPRAGEKCSSYRKSSCYLQIGIGFG